MHLNTKSMEYTHIEKYICDKLCPDAEGIKSRQCLYFINHDIFQDDVEDGNLLSAIFMMFGEWKSHLIPIKNHIIYTKREKRK